MLPPDDRTRRLEQELDSAYRAILGLMPDDVETLLLSYIRAESRDDFDRWERDVTDKIILKGKPFSHGHERRAYCPLCRASSSSPYSEGFSHPEGLKRHLTGFGNTQQCVVMLAAFALERGRRHRLFDEIEREEWAQETAAKALRRTTETVYQTAPDVAPELLDEGIYLGVRDATAMAFAEKRLAELGFQSKTEGKVKSYTLERDTFVVYADPREQGRIDFAVFKKPLPKPSRRPRVRVYPRFHILDAWKNNLREKFETRLADAV